MRMTPWVLSAARTSRPGRDALASRDERRCMSQPKLRVAIYPFEPRLEIRAQMLLAIEEIGHAGDINDQPGGAVLRGMRPIAAGPPAHLFKRRPFAHRIGVAHGQHWAKAAVAPFQLMSKSARVLALFSPRLCRCLAKPAAPGSGYRSSGSRPHGLPCPSGSASDSWFGPPRMRTEATAHGQRDRLSRRGNDQPDSLHAQRLLGAPEQIGRASYLSEMQPFRHAFRKRPLHRLVAVIRKHDTDDRPGEPHGLK